MLHLFDCWLFICYNATTGRKNRSRASVCSTAETALPMFWVISNCTILIDMIFVRYILHRIHTQIACSHEYFSPLLVSEENLNSSESCYCVIPERVPYISRLVWQSVYQLMFTLYAFCQNKIKIIVISCFSSSSMHASHWKIFWKICSVIDCLSSLASNHSTIAKKSRRNGIPIRPIEWCLCKNIVRENLRQEENRCQRDWEVKPYLYLVYDFSANSNVFIIQDGARVQQC